MFYFNAFRRRSKSLETLDLIKECYFDQISLFNTYVKMLIQSFKENRSKRLLFKGLIRFKNFEGCNKKIMKSLVLEIKKIDDSIDLDSAETKNLFEFDDQMAYYLKNFKKFNMKSIDKPMCGCGNTSNPNGYCDGSHSNK